MERPEPERDGARAIGDVDVVVRELVGDCRRIGRYAVGTFDDTAFDECFCGHAPSARTERGGKHRADVVNRLALLDIEFDILGALPIMRLAVVDAMGDLVEDAIGRALGPGRLGFETVLVNRSLCNCPAREHKQAERQTDADNNAPRGRTPTIHGYALPEKPRENDCKACTLRTSSKSPVNKKVQLCFRNFTLDKL